MSYKTDNNQSPTGFHKEGVQSCMDFKDEQNEQSFETEGPVTCLGMTFANDSERRKHFREELRKKLPELKKIEGFPIGEDEDIINLSDPPYYTACPNPWLNDFIKQWEEEKQQLVDEGKRIEEKVVTEPYASDVSEGKNNPIYMAHAYHTKVPHPAIMRYILHYTEPGDIVFDGFAGTGMTGVAANLCGSTKDVVSLQENGAKIGTRHGICSDLSPIASIITACYNLKININSLIHKAKNIVAQVDKELGWMFEYDNGQDKCRVNYTVWSDVCLCPSCGHEIIMWDGAVTIEKNEIVDTFLCPHCSAKIKKSQIQRASETYYDHLLDKSVTATKKVPVLDNITKKTGERLDIPFSNTTVFEKVDKLSGGKYLGKIPEGDESSRNFAHGFFHLHQLFTRRNQLYLSRVVELTKGDVFLTAWFTSIIQNASKMYKFRLDRKGGIVSGTLFIPSYNIEQNPSKLLLGKINDFAKIDYSTRGCSINQICSSTSLNRIGDSSIDYIFIDPPFGSNLMYSELNSIFEGWIGVCTDNAKEAVVSKQQGKNLFEYQRLMNESLKEFFRILKPGKWLTMEFSNTSASVWNSIQNALQGVGFVVANVAALDKKQGSFKAVTTTTAVKQDLVITCYKPSEATTNAFTSSENTDKNVWDFIDEYLHHLPVHIERNDSTTVVVERSPKILYDRLISYYVQHGYSVPMDAADFQAGLRERYLERDGMFFTSEQASEYESKKKSLPGGVISMGILVNSEADGIQWLRNELSLAPKTRQDLYTGWMQARGAVRKGDRLPELDDILEENFIKEAGGKWRVPNANDEKDLEILRNKALLKEFNLCVEQASKPKSKIKEVRVEALRAGFKQCYIDKDFKTIILVGDKIPENLLTEDEVLLQYYDIASSRV